MLEFHLTFANASAQLKQTDWATDSFFIYFINSVVVHIRESRNCTKKIIIKFMLT
jgi:hypothetical protein